MGSGTPFLHVVAMELQRRSAEARRRGSKTEPRSSRARRGAPPIAEERETPEEGPPRLGRSVLSRPEGSIGRRSALGA